MMTTVVHRTTIYSTTTTIIVTSQTTQACTKNQAKSIKHKSSISIQPIKQKISQTNQSINS